MYNFILRQKKYFFEHVYYLCTFYSVQQYYGGSLIYDYYILYFIYTQDGWNRMVRLEFSLFQS